MDQSFWTAVSAQTARLLSIAVLFVLATPFPTHGQADTTNAAAADTASTPTDGAVPDDPVSFSSAPYGHPVVDSLPAVTPHEGLEHILAQEPGSFLYDLGAVGWPHGWSPAGLGPHRSRLWIEGRPYNSPLTGRARFDLLPPSFLTPPRSGMDPGGSSVGVHTSWRDYDQLRPVTELRYRRGSNGQNAIAVSHSQKHRVSVFGSPGVLQATLGFGGRGTDGAYEGSDLRSERRLWGRLRYQRDEWAVAVTNFSSRRRIGAHSGVLPPVGQPFSVSYVLPFCATCSQEAGASRATFRNDLTVRAEAPLIPGTEAPTSLSATWTSNTFDFEPDPGGDTTNTTNFGSSSSDTTWAVVMNGGHSTLRQPVQVGAHTLTLEARGSLWRVERSNVSPVGGRRWAAHVTVRDSVQFGSNQVTANVGWHGTSSQQYPSAVLQLDRPLGPLDLSGSLSATGQRLSWFETAGFPGFVRPLEQPASRIGRVLRGRVGLAYQNSPIDVKVDGFAHQIRGAVDLFAPPVAAIRRTSTTDSVVTRRTDTPIRRVGASVAAGWRRDAARGVYVTGTGTAITTLNEDASRLHSRLARTLPTLHGRGRIGMRFVLFDLFANIYMQVRGWTRMTSRWFHPPTGRLIVPPQATSAPLPQSQTRVGPSGTIDLHAEIKLRGATLFLALEHASSSFASPDSFEGQATLESGTSVVPTYPLPARLFRFGVHWPIFD